jgi:peptidoglycan/xylan/chitin deacetylase (PgdA/CDA1 family)
VRHDAGGRLAFAEAAKDAWVPPSGLSAMLRHHIRSAVISAASLAVRAHGSFVRCLYSHAVFPEHAAKFRRFIRHLKQNGDIVSTDTLLELSSAQRHPQGRYFHLSFDDGFANVFEVACDILTSEGATATIFIATEMVERDYEDLLPYFSRMNLAYSRPIRTITWKNAKIAASSGFEIGSHTRTHRRLSDLSNSKHDLFDEVVHSRKVIEEKLGIACSSFAWPFGTMQDIDDLGFAAIREAGYLAAFSAVRGRIRAAYTDIHALPRHQVEFHWPFEHLTTWAAGFMESG